MTSLLIAAVVAAGQAAPTHVGSQVADFTLTDYLGAKYSLVQFESEVVVVAFLGTECPLAKLYGSRLAELDEKYGDAVTFVGINSNQQDTPTEMGHYARAHGVEFPLLKDPGNRIADQLRAERTPEVFVLDRERVVRYWGRIDDQFGVGYSRPQAKHDYLVEAIDALLAGEPVARPETKPIGCHIGRVTREEPTGDITYTKQIARILQRRCVECHRDGGIAPFSLTSYEDVAGWAETAREVMEDQRMPPWHANPKFGHFENDSRMPVKEKALFYQWIDNGVPEGAADDLPAPLEFFDGWSIGKPDLVVRMPEPITVPANGIVDYQYVTIDLGLAEGKWLQASEIRPGVRSVVHHVIAFLKPPGADPILEERGIGFETAGGYVPGAPPMQLDDGIARYIPAGTELVLQLHYTPDGRERQDQTEIGLRFADPKTVKHSMQNGVVANLDFVIPPNDDRYRVEGTHRFSHDMLLYTLAPHMHYRGKSFRYEVTYPNGTREVLLDVPRYDFNWQNAYSLAKPMLMPEGTIMKCIAYFDNSDANLANPDPSIEVRWGEQTWEEMMIGFYEGVFLNQDLSLPEPVIKPVGDDEYLVRFNYRPDRPAESVHVAGTFNEWSTSQHPLNDPDGDGTYTAEVRLKRGGHRYKFVVDGNFWTHDPASRILTGFVAESFFVAGGEE